MAIIRTPIHDDDGSGTTGTILDNAWKQELYNQIDAAGAAAAAVGSVVLHKTQAGLSTPGYAVIDSYLMPALSQNDVVKIYISLYLSMPSGSLGTAINLAASGDAAMVRLDNVGGGVMLNGSFGWYDITLRPVALSAVFWNTIGIGNVSGSLPALIASSTNLGHSNWLNGGWPLSVEGVDLPAGAAIYMSWAVIKL